VYEEEDGTLVVENERQLLNDIAAPHPTEALLVVRLDHESIYAYWKGVRGNRANLHYLPMSLVAPVYSPGQLFSGLTVLTMLTICGPSAESSARKVTNTPTASSASSFSIT